VNTRHSAHFLRPRPLATYGATVRTFDFTTPSRFVKMVGFVVVVTGSVYTVKVAVWSPVGTVTEYPPGTVTARLLEPSPTTTGSVPAAQTSFTVAVTEPPPTTEVGDRVSDPSPRG
jgi:hypothetical protein